MVRSVLRFAATMFVTAAVSTTAMAQNAFDTSRMDRSADACTDFYQFANGSWMKTTEIPSTESRWGTFNFLYDNNLSMLRQVLESASKANAPANSDAQLIGDFYTACMDEAAIEKAGLKPVESYLKACKR